MKYIYILLFLLLSLKLNAQDYTIKRLGVENGLSNNYVMNIAQDKKGFMWFATESGLSRFDGNNFRVYKKNTSKDNAISANALNMVYTDKVDDIIWIASQREGLNMFDYQTETFKTYKHDQTDPHSIATNDITCITNAIDGNLWVSTYHKGFEYFDKETQKFTHYNQATIPELPSNSIWSIIQAKNGLLYIGHVNSGFSIYSPSDNTIKNYRYESDNSQSLPGNNVNTIFIDNNENIWLGTDAGLALFNPITEGFTVFKHEPNNSKSLIGNFIHSIAQVEDGKLWIGTENGGISILDIQQSMFSTPESTQFVNIEAGDDQYSLSDQTVRSILQDTYGNIWIGLYGGGINFISNRQSFFKNWTYSPIPGIKNSLSNKIAWGIAADADDRLWIGTDGGGIDLFENNVKIKTFNQENSSLSDNAILASFKDSRNNIWFGTFDGGINIYDSQAKQLSALEFNNPLDIRCFSEDNQGNIWIGGSNGIYVYDYSKGVTQSYTKENSELRENLVRSIYHDHKGNIWLAFFGEGIAIYSPEMKLINYYDVTKGFPSNLVNHITHDRSGNIWIGTGEGVVCFPNGDNNLSPIIYNEKSGMIDSHARAIIEDFRGNIWISTTSGISYLDLKANKFYNYDHFNGMPFGEFMSGSATQTSDNTIYFGSQNGVCYFSPSSMSSITTLPPVVITNFNIYDNKVELSESEISIPIKPTIKLNHNQNTFEISFNILDYSLNHITEYSYMLKGLEDSWYASQSNNFVTFRNIPHGSYEFLIRSRVKNQEWTDNITSLDIKIAPPLWLTWWAKCLYLILTILFVKIIIKFYKRKLNLENSLILEKKNHLQEQEINNERLRFFTNITHELRTPLTLILGPLEDLTIDDSLSQKHISKINVIYKSATRLLNLINQILEFRKTETENKKLKVGIGNLDQLIFEVGLKYKELNTKEKISFNIIVEEGDYQIYYDPDVISTILENLISNAYKYTDCGDIILSLRMIEEQDTRYAEIEVRDTGRGIQPESMSKIFDRYFQEQNNTQSSATGIGLALVHKLVLLHQGSIMVNSEVGKGSSFRFRIESNNKYLNAIHSELEEEKDQEEDIEAEDIYEGDDKHIILIIEDNEEINQYIVDSLSDLYTVYSANDGQEGLEKIYLHIPDIVISDIMMPQIDGFELTKILKEDIRTSHIPIVLLTAKDTLQDRTKGYSIGADSYITKPFSANLLKSRISNILSSRKKLAELIQKDTGDKASLMTESLNALDKEFIEKVRDIIEQNINAESLDVNFIANQLFMSHSTLYRKIKALTDLTANEFIRKIRIIRAEELLLTGKYTISEISFMVGINSISYFRQNFKDEFGLPPSEYIKKLKG